jgi:hypothetical protein
VRWIAALDAGAVDHAVVVNGQVGSSTTQMATRSTGYRFRVIGSCSGYGSC